VSRTSPRLDSAPDHSPLLEIPSSGENASATDYHSAIADLTTLAILEGKTAEILAQKEHLEQLTGWFEIALDNMARGLSMFDAEQRLIVCNKIYREIYGLPHHITQPGTTLAEIMRFHANMETGVECPEAVEQERAWLKDHEAKLARGAIFSEEQHLGDGRTLLVTFQPLGNGGWVDIQEDITERKRFEERIAHLAHHDALTDLPNRVVLRERLMAALAAARREDRRFAVLILDLDRFKDVNDTLGHLAGDAVLKEVANRLRLCVREGDLVARLGGDEFAILESVSTNPSVEAVALAKRIIESLNSPFVFDGHSILSATSIGIAVAPQDGADVDEILKNADLALYRAKAVGRSAYCFFDPEMGQRMQERLALERDLRQALANKELELFYQPLINLKSNEICGCEALLRWNHPTRGRVSPAEFIPLAEETGLILSIGDWVLRQACAEAATWPAGLKIAVNLSVSQFKSPILVQQVISALASSGLPPQRLELEITESVMIEDGDAALVAVSRLRELGVAIALDDFGTGYSSLSYLRRFPFDKIKIDRSFVSCLTDKNDQAAVILRAFSGLGISLGMATTAEGVETEEQLERVRAEGCTEVQGYYFSKPVPAVDIAALLAPRASADDRAA
jgi:diguanylate cyclase (GGDEF)-like protein